MSCAYKGRNCHDACLYVRTKQWDGAFLKEMKSKFTFSHEQLEGPEFDVSQKEDMDWS